MKTNTNALSRESDTQVIRISRKALWAGRIIRALPALFLVVDGIMKLVKPEPVVKATIELGYPESTIPGIGIVLLVCVILYLVPRASVLGAILLTGYLGGAVATHVRVGSPLFTHILFPVYLAVLGRCFYNRFHFRQSLLELTDDACDGRRKKFVRDSCEFLLYEWGAVAAAC